MDDALLYEKVISENAEKGTQLKLVLSTFRDVEYVHFRKYYMSYDSGYLPTKEGISFPANIPSIYALLDGLIELCANAEGIDSIVEHFGEKLEKLKHEQTTRVSESGI